ncbi:uncharacterized protein BDW43DRAFT_296194 [Aspergillus alliaceus]|uniref:uncharacterized protein n=1 Tax=Petromyces alliaceus TaxID=209559 RepID=UPI0012A492C9|nr:uncharacterized protein BDW43DRAFT_296194 [Aspergillus alliaceus]KAB8238757.1 hypothetical protein BDW43DRAFT_296194 [Aspergillus alliaceus]
MTTYKIESCYDITQGFIIEQATKRQPRNLLRDLEKVRHEKADDPVTGTIVGYARWILPSGMAGSTGAGYECGREQTVSGTGGISPVGMRGDMDALEDRNYGVIDRILAEKPHIKLDYMAAHPGNKGKWIGTALVTSGMRYAEMARAPIFCMAFKAECGVYARLGAGEYGAYFMMYDVPQKV